MNCFYLGDESQFPRTAIFLKGLVNNAMSVSKNNLLEINTSVSELIAFPHLFLIPSFQGFVAEPALTIIIN